MADWITWEDANGRINAIDLDKFESVDWATDGTSVLFRRPEGPGFFIRGDADLVNDALRARFSTKRTGMEPSIKR